MDNGGKIHKPKVKFRWIVSFQLICQYSLILSLVIFHAPIKSWNQFISMYKLKTDYSCYVKLWLMYLFTIIFPFMLKTILAGCHFKNLLQFLLLRYIVCIMDVIIIRNLLYFFQYYHWYFHLLKCISFYFSIDLALFCKSSVFIILFILILIISLTLWYLTKVDVNIFIWLCIYNDARQI